MRWMAMVCMMMPVPACAQGAEALFGADGYRISHYRGPVPGAPEGVGRITVQAVAGLRGRALLIDVMPAEGARRDPDGVWHLAAARQGLPGEHWFPEAGRGVPAPDIAAWFEKGIARLTRGRKDRMIVTFCLSDCWMSWNAARRLRALGYTRVWWLAEGTDGWRDAGLPMIDAVPEGK
jgi:PQQ-dependent catabolism-associated CXXCW motif protein